MEKLLKVSDEVNLVRDSETGVVLNYNKDEYENYKRKLQRLPHTHYCGPW